MQETSRCALVGLSAAFLLSSAPARAGVQVTMSVEGVKGPFAGQGQGVGANIKALGVVTDFTPGAATQDGKAALRPIVVTRVVDRFSGDFLEALVSNEFLDVVITIVQTTTDVGLLMRRVIRLANARVVAIHDATDAKNVPAPGLGLEILSLSYERIDIEDDGMKVFSAGG